jgi:hypothetical protein
MRGTLGDLGVRGDMCMLLRDDDVAIVLPVGAFGRITSSVVPFSTSSSEEFFKIFKLEDFVRRVDMQWKEG